MPISLSTPEGTSVSIDEPVMPETVVENASAFERANGAQLSEDEKLRPPKRVDKTDPTYTPNPDPVDKPRRGRPKKEDPADKSRTSKATPKEPLKPKDFTGELNATFDAVWLGGSQFPVAAPYAGVFHMYQPGLVHALNEGAQVNHGVRNFCEKMTSGTGNAWMLELAVVGVNMGMAMYSMSKNPEMAQAVAEANAVAVKEYVDGIAQVQTAGA
jgi:hypothetical protein